MSLAWNDLPAAGVNAFAINNVQFQTPIPGVNVAYVLRQRFMQLTASYTALALNTAHGTYATYLLVSEENFKDEGGGVQTWDRVYAKTPATHTLPSSMAYAFIGYFGELIPVNGYPINVTLDPSAQWARKQESRLVGSKHVFDYFLVGTGGTYSTQFDIPVIQETRYLGPTIGGIISQLPVEVLWDTTMHTPSGATITFALPSNPTLTTYKGWVATDAGSASTFSIVAVGSKLDLWMGNIFRRETIYVKAR